jgi:ADP-heptose:LPS heptosyltransferase
LIAAARTSLPVLAAVISRFAVLITNDSGPAHMAYALKTPCVTVFGGADPARYGPHQAGPFQVIAYPVECRPCTFSDCPIGTICLENVHPAEVVRAAERLMRANPAPHPG